TNAIIYYSRLPHLETILINDQSTLMSQRVLDALNTFPSLKTVAMLKTNDSSKEDIHGCSEYHDLSVASFKFQFAKLTHDEMATFKE
ncbi:MAG: hypothetical protein AAFN77_24795, partial [Planctomycetota bacterium]